MGKNYSYAVAQFDKGEKICTLLHQEYNSDQWFVVVVHCGEEANLTVELCYETFWFRNEDRNLLYH